MACFRPVSAWQLDSGDIVFAERGSVRRALTLPCNSCIGCQLARARSWAIRCMHESRSHVVNSFVTFTYDADHFPYDGGLRYIHFQRFMKKLRNYGQCRFFCCGEYGDRFKRPHFHALLFGYRPSDGKEAGKDLYSSESLNRLWGHGDTRFGDVTFASAGYVAKYCLKKVGSRTHTERYRRVDAVSGEVFQVEPEFAHMSLRPGLGYAWFQKYWREVYLARDGVVLPGGRVLPSPSYYDSLLMASAPEVSEEKQFSRYLNSLQFQEDCTPERLAVREVCAKAKLTHRYVE